MSTASNSTGKSARAAMIVAAVMIGQNLAGRALRDGFFLSHFEPNALPTVMIGSSLLSVALVLSSARVFRRFAPVHALPVLFACSALLFVAEWALSFRAPGLAAIAVYLHTTSIGAVVVSGFWSVVNERFDPHTAKQLIGRIAGGATLGGVLGGLAVWQGAAALSIATMILCLGGLNAACAIGVPVIGSRSVTTRREEETDDSALTIFEQTPYLRHLALLVALIAFGAAIYDYAFKAKAAARFGSGGELVGFFALFYLGVGVATFLAQNLLAKRSLARLGLAGNVATLPGAACLLGPLALLFPGLPTMAALRGGTAVLESSLYRSGYELLYTPLSPEKKRPTKTLIDVGGDKLGAAAGGGFAFLVLGIVPEAAEPVLLCAAIGTALAGLLVTRDLHKGYIASLAESLHNHSIAAAELDTVDAATRQAVAETIAFIDRSAVRAGTSSASSGGGSISGTGAHRIGRAEVLAQLRPAARADRAEDLTDTGSPAEVPPRAPAVAPIETWEIDDTLVAIAHLRAGDTARVLATLRRHKPLPDALVGHVVDLLDDDAVAETASEALRTVAPAHTGLLLDTVLRLRSPPPVRRRICDILATLPTQRCASGLVQLLADSEFELRFRAAAALLRVVQRNSALRLPGEQLFAAAGTEAHDCGRLWRYQTTIEGKLTDVAPAHSAAGKRVIHGLAYVFTLLFTVLDREPLRLAIGALAADDAAQRGTGLEYLHNVLPPDLREALWPLLEDRRLSLGTLRSESDILAEIIGQARPGAIDLEAVRKRVKARRADTSH